MWQTITKTINKLKFVHVFWTVFYLLFLVILINNGASYLDPDFGWHLKVGQEIATSGQVPHANLYNYTYTGNWVDHEWLSNLVLYKTYSFAGYNTILFIFAALIILTLILLNFFVYKKNKSDFGLIAALQAIGILASTPHLGVRMQESALIFILLLLLIINYYQKSKNWKILISLPIIFFLWASLHASFLIGFFILFSWIGIKLLENVSPIKKVKFLDLSELLKLKTIYYFIIASIGSLIATCLTPYGLNLYSFLVGYKNKAYLSLIVEWLPQSALPLNLLQLIYLALGSIAIFFYTYERLKNKEKINIWKIFLPIIFLILSFKSKRHFPLFFIASFELMTDIFTAYFKDIKLPYTKYLKWLLVFCLILVLFLKSLQLKNISNPFESFCNNYPCRAVNFLNNNPQYKDNNIFNEYVWGGFLIWAMPDKKIFIDGRLPQVAFSKWTFVEEYHNFISNENDIPDKLKEYNIRLVLIKTKEEHYIAKWWEKLFVPIKTNSNSGNKLAEYLNKTTSWKIIYQDEVAKIYFYAN